MPNRNNDERLVRNALVYDIGKELGEEWRVTHPLAEFGSGVLETEKGWRLTFRLTYDCTSVNISGYFPYDNNAFYYLAREHAPRDINATVERGAAAIAQDIKRKILTALEKWYAVWEVAKAARDVKLAAIKARAETMRALWGASGYNYGSGEEQYVMSGIAGNVHYSCRVDSSVDLELSNLTDDMATTIVKLITSAAS